MMNAVVNAVRNAVSNGVRRNVQNQIQNQIQKSLSLGCLLSIKTKSKGTVSYADGLGFGDGR